jgi:capsular polysaccharide export protein
MAPDAFITYKPHPDVEAGHRVGAIPRQVALRLADEIVQDQPIGALIELVDEVHVNTSLAGFEALLRGRAVVTHGVPFYAGWGVTRDLGLMPSRRSAKRTVDELVAAVLLLYPRYLDPETGLPCPPELLISRLTSGTARGRAGVLVHLRRMQGRFKRALSSFRGGHQA